MGVIQWGCVEIPCPHSLWFREHKRPFHAVHLSVWQAGWLAGGICLSVCCWCAYAWGRSAGAPSPRGPRSVYAGAPKPALCLFVLALWFCLHVYVFLGAVACVSLCLCGCAMVSLSLHHPCVLLGICLSIPLLVLCPWLSQREGGLHHSSTNKLVSNCIFQSVY